MNLLDLSCPSCRQDIEVNADFDTIGNEVVCPHCSAESNIWYDYCYDEQTGDENGWFYLETKFNHLP